MNNILATCTMFDVNILKISNELRDKIDKEFCNLDADCEILRMSEENIDEFNIPSEAIDYDSCEFDEYLLEDILTNVLGKYPYYLVFGANIKWNGASGYKIVDNILDTCARDYDIELSIQETGKRKVTFIESSHDVPMGSFTYMIGLSNEEYENLENADFNKIEEFVVKTI